MTNTAHSPAVITGTNGNDRLTGTDGDDSFDGLQGNDSYHDQGGSDRYIFATGYGSDWIYESTDNAGNADIIELKPGLTPADISISRHHNTLTITITDSWN